MCACTESDVRESATRLHSRRPINFTLGLKVRQCALLSALLTHSAIGSYSSDPRQMLFRLHAPFPVSSTVERTVLLHINGCDSVVKFSWYCWKFLIPVVKKHEGFEITEFLPSLIYNWTFLQFYKHHHSQCCIHRENFLLNYRSCLCWICHIKPQKFTPSYL
jgi:hypothetical protein